MNKQRRKTIDELIEKIEALKDDVQSVLDDEQEYRDGIPESMTDDVIVTGGGSPAWCPLKKLTEADV